ncbi:flavin-containing monooxygenase [Streptomyces sp. NPDC054933]
MIIGSGFGGLAVAISLKLSGHENFTIVEKAADIGGVWRDNTYPGAACDVPAHLYSYSFERGYNWSRRYAEQADILGYLRLCVDKYRLTGHLRLETEIMAAQFDEADGRWRLRTRAGESITADVVVPACGQLSRPRYPDIPGIERYEGRWFHSARWDHDHDLFGKWVAVIGTGASAIQIIPAIAPKVSHLTVFQRSAPYVTPKWDQAYRPTDHGVLRRSAARLVWWLFNELLTLGLTLPHGIKGMGGAPFRTALRLAERGSNVQLRKQIDDPAVREKMTPKAEVGCKRLGVSSTYYPTFNRANVSLVTEPVTEMTEQGVRTADGREHRVDTLVFATGFTSTEFLAPMRVFGRDGVELADVWRDGACAHLGMAVPGFPNMFLVYGPNTNIGGGSAVYMLESQARYITQAVAKLAAGVRRHLEVRPEVYGAFAEEMRRRGARTVWATCRNWYRNAGGRITNNWPGMTNEYRRRTARLNLADYQLT